MKQAIKLTLFMAFILALVMPVNAFSGGNGTSDNPWQISNIDELQSMNDDTAYYNDYFVLINDINATETLTWHSGAGFVPIEPFAAFAGSFDGQGYNIDGLHIYRPSETYVAMFDEIWYNAHVYNFTMTNVNITGGAITAGVVAESDFGTTIENIGIKSGNVTGSSTTGGIISRQLDPGGIVRNVYNNASVISTSSTSYRASGIVGTNYGTIQYAYSKGYTFSPTVNSAGVCGSNYGTVSNCYYDLNTTLADDNGIGTPKTTAEMQTESTFENWDFDTVWIMSDYPVFRYEVTGLFFTITVRDESTYELLCPDSVKLFDEDVLYNGVIDCINNETTINTSYFDSNHNFIISVAADGYYNRQTITSTDKVYNDIDMFLISENETVIYDQFDLTDYLRQYEYTDCIIRLDKPFENGTETVYSSYFDYNGVSATYLIASDQYILYIVTPDSTVSYGWLTPDADGEINIVINEFDFEDYTDWLSYTFDLTDTYAKYEYESEKTVSESSMIVSYLNGTEVYNVSASTDIGSFYYAFSGNETLQITISVVTDDGFEYSYSTFKEFEPQGLTDPFPDSYSMLDKSVIIFFVIIVGVIASSMYRKELAAIWTFIVYAVAVSQEWCYGNAYTVSIIGIIALILVVKFYKRRARSLN